VSIPAFSFLPVSGHAPEAISVIGLVKNAETLELVAHPGFEHLLPIAKTLDAPTALESITKVVDPANPERTVALLGLGSQPVTTNTLRLAAGAATRKLSETPAVEFHIPVATENEAAALAEGALLGAYAFTRYKSKVSSPSQLAQVFIRTHEAVSDELAATVREKAAAVALVKDLVNTPPSDLTPSLLADEAVAAVAGLSVHATVWDFDALERDGFGGILGVGRGSANPPRLVKLDYSPQGAAKHISLVGKGITFDTGGLTLKSGSGMVGMKYDMTGAATALAVLRAAAALQLPVHVTAWLCLAENMPSGSATKPNDVLRIRNGKTVEVLNTDAEGRLVLADGLSVASEEHPDVIIDIATLTGASRGALGTRTVGAMGNPDEVSRLVETAGLSGEAVWRMPMPEELRALLNSDIADLINGKPGNTVAGMLLAAVFLSEFVGPQRNSADNTPIPWIHLDIAGTADNSGSPYGFTGSGPTGVTVRALIDYLSASA
jgi:leucyl aminopeptidase